jgi:hypothetical protein
MDLDNIIDYIRFKNTVLELFDIVMDHPIKLLLQIIQELRIFLTCRTIT